jgi:hypothetical protein
MINIPEQLRNEEFRFFLVCKNSKRPYEKKWNTQACYPYHSHKLKSHDGNYGIVCGFGDLVVLDFDDKAFYDSVKDKLPKTFTVTSASKRLPHLYYILKDSDVKVGKMYVDGDDGKRLCDIQSQGQGIVGPGSSIDRKYYEPNDHPIVDISVFDLVNILDPKLPGVKTAFKGANVNNPRKKDIALAVLHLSGVELGEEVKNYKCPFHKMSGQGNLTLLDTGKVYCHHCLGHWWPDELLAKVKNIPYWLARSVVKSVEIMYEEAREDGRDD